MASHMGMDYQLNTIDPRDPKNARIQITIPHSVCLYFYKYYPVRYENLRVAKEVLQNPKRIFSGIRAHNEGGWCFTGRPKEWHIKEAVIAPFPDDLIFTVYINPRLRLYESRADVAAKDDPESPKDWQSRFGVLIWKNIS